MSNEPSPFNFTPFPLPFSTDNRPEPPPAKKGRPPKAAKKARKTRGRPKKAKAEPVSKPALPKALDLLGRLEEEIENLLGERQRLIDSVIEVLK